MNKSGEKTNSLEENDCDLNLNNESLIKIKFIPRQYLIKGKITPEHAQRSISPGEDVTVEKKA